MDDRIVFGALLASVEVIDTAVLLEPVVLLGMGELLATGAAATGRLDGTVSELVGELLGGLLTHVPRPVSVVALLKEAIDAPPESEAANRALTAELLEGSVVQLLADRVARLIDGVELLDGLGELWDEVAEFNVELSVLEAIEELFTDFVMLLLNNTMGEGLFVLVAEVAEFNVEPSVPEAAEALFADFVMLLLNNTMGEGLFVLVVEVAEFNVELSVPEAVEALFADFVMLLLNNTMGEGLSVLVVENPELEETAPVQLPNAD